MSLTARTNDSAIDMELSVLSEVPEEEHEPQEKDTLMGSLDDLKIEIPVPRELEMAQTPRIPRKSFADIRDPSSGFGPACTSTPAPVSQSKGAKSKRVSRRNEDSGLSENNSNTSETTADPESKDFSSSSTTEPCECDDVSPKNHGQFMLFLAVIGLSVLAGFLAGYFLREEKFKQEKLLIEEEACVVSRIPTGLTAEQLRFHNQAMRKTSQDDLQNYASLLSSPSCTNATTCSKDLPDNLVTMLKDLGLSNVDISTYNVLVSLPDLTRPSTLRTKDGDGNVLHTVHLYGGESEENSNKDLLSPGANAPAGDINKRSAIDDPFMSPPSPMYVPYSASGSVEGDLIYVNCASASDFAEIDDLGIDLVGRIAIARQCDMMTMKQAKNVENEGMIGLILYTDPADESVPTMQSGMDVSMGMSGMYGDPLTPGCPAMEGTHRMADTNLPGIPIQTVTPDVAMSLLDNITGKVAPEEWQGGLNITYNVGRKSRTPLWTVELDIHNTMEQRDIHNVMVTLPGTDYPDEYVLMGAHYYTTGVTSMMSNDPTVSTATGSVSMAMETATVLGDLLDDGWEPKRTVMLGLWEGADMANVGSMEWVEEHRNVLADRAVAYIDLDTMMGPGMKIMAETSPVLMGVIMEAAEQLELTDVVATTTLDGLGDHVPFSHMLGIPSVSFHTVPVSKYSSPVPDIDVSTTMLATQTLLLLADDPMIRYDGFSLAEMVMEYVDSLETLMEDTNVTMVALKQTANKYMQNVLTLQNMVDELDVLGDPVTMAMINDRLLSMEKSFVMDGTKDTMRHILYGSHQTETFSIMMDTISDKDVTMETVEEMLSVIQCILQSATTSLALTLT